MLTIAFAADDPTGVGVDGGGIPHGTRRRGSARSMSDIMAVAAECGARVDGVADARSSSPTPKAASHS